jgi:hypothetical protein
MNWLQFLLLTFGALLAPAGEQEKVNPGSLLLSDFSKRVADYVKLHQAARAEVHALKKPTDSSEVIEQHVHQIAHLIREKRSGAIQGSIFTPEISAEFRRLLSNAMQGPQAEHVRGSLRHAEPLRQRPLRVNHAYPEGLPLQSTPPSLLLNLPPLPPEVEYRIVGHSLILRDVEANLIVDFIPDAIP